jgi:hypothetical protein
LPDQGTERLLAELRAFRAEARPTRPKLYSLAYRRQRRRELRAAERYLRDQGCTNSPPEAIRWTARALAALEAIQRDIDQINSLPGPIYI